MCGITGILAFTDKGRLQISKVQQSVRTLQLRGPDDEGVFMNSDVGLAQTRLSIIDISERGNQPMWDRTGRYVMIYNGEIFNYRELRETYFSPEERSLLKSSSDTEILLELFVKKGINSLDLLEGFFAFAVYDTHEKELIIVRDRFGQKPLLIFQDEDKILFASEQKALLAFGIPKELNYDAVKLYLQFAYIPSPLGILKGIRKLPPGHLLILKEGQSEERNWYQIKCTTDYSQAPTYSDAKKGIYSLLERAVVKRLVSDVPLGAFLSGGIDSSIIVALASRNMKGLNTFSIGYEGEDFFDETHYADLVAKKYKTNHTRFVLSHQDYLDHVMDVLNYLDEPFADTSALPQFILCHEVRKHATVAISGDGADELFAGYNKHYAEMQIRKKSVISSLVRAGSPLWKMLPKSRTSRLTNMFRQLYRFAEGAGLPAAERYWQWASTFTESEVNQLVAEPVTGKFNSYDFEKIKSGFLKEISPTDFNSILKTDFDLVLAGDMLVKVDLMSMANSVEVRCPFLDHELVEYSFGLPAEYKIRGKRRKMIIKDAFRDLLPPEIYTRGKQGFEIPLLKWFRNELNTFIMNDLLNESFIREQGIFNYDYISQLKNQLNSNRPEDIVEKLWVLIVFQYWYKKYYI